MIITNTHKDPLGLPTGQVLAPNTPTPVSNWDEIRKNAVVSAWVRSGLLKETGNPASDQGSKFVQPDKAELQAKLDALGVHYDKRAGVAKLQALLLEANTIAATSALLDVLGVRHDPRDGIAALEGLLGATEASDPEGVEKAKETLSALIGASGLSPEEWVALSADERESQLEAFEAAQG